jgi:CheY-like chemotaxis protein/HPt (histidine-containing phosphotransfer) domain-containing protein
MAEQMKIKGHADEDELDIFYHSSQYLLQIVNEVLDYSRITSGRFQFDNRTFDMRRLLKEVANSAMVQAAQKGLKFIDKRDHIDALYVSGDPFRLKQVLYNLLGNAIKFTEKGSVSFSAACREQEGRLRFVFTISDTGIGIAGDKLENIFSEFETLNTSPLQKYKGTGLGLNIAKALVEGQGGSINVSSTQGKGSTFTVSIPFDHSNETITETIGTEEELNIAFNGQVWVVDDDKFILQLCHTILDKYNIPHKYFSTPEAVLSEPYDDAPVIVLLDIRLPGMSGMDVCSALKRRKGFAETKFIALTAQVLPDEKENIIHSGFDNLLAKPFMEQELLQMILKGAKQQGLIYEREERFDLSALNKLTGSDEELLQIAIDNFIAETERDLHDWQIAVKEDDYELMTGVLHRLASRCGQIGMRKLLKQLRDKEVSISHSKTLQGMETSLNNLYKTVQGVMVQLKNFSIPIITETNNGKDTDSRR